MSLASITAQDPLAGFCIGKTLPLEGGLSDNPKDPGGETNFGVSLRYALAQVTADPSQLRWFDMDHDGHVDRRDIEGLSKDAAADIYFADWWTPGWYGRLVPQLVAWKTFDVAVNTGPKRSATILQKALGAAGSPVPVDAQVGPQTVAAVRAQNARDGGVALLDALRSTQAAFYRRLVLLADGKLDWALHGWLNRAAA